MPNPVGVTNPVPGFDNTNGRVPPGLSGQSGAQQSQNVPDPTRVGRPDARTDQKGADDAAQSGVLRYDSNLQFFLQQLRDMPELTVQMDKVLAWLRVQIGTPGLSGGVAAELSALLQSMRMEPQDFAQFFLQQAHAGSRFAGPLFSLLRQAFAQSPSDTVREGILNFVKRYSDYSSTEHIGRTMVSLLKQISDSLPRSWRGQLAELTGRLENGLQSGNRTETLKLLQSEILPYLGSYISRFHDMGRPRTLLSMLMLNVARYENGKEEEVMASFRQLSGYGDTLTGLNQLDDAALWKLLQENTFTRAAAQDQFAGQMAELIHRALRGECGADAREAMQELLRALLINESVYLPLNHMLLPLEWNGKRMYSELWVDPDAPDDGREGSGEEEEGKIQFLFKLDIDSLGFFEMTLAARKDQVDLNVYAPESVTAHASLVEEDLAEILSAHGLTGKRVRVQQELKPLVLTDVFPDLLEGKRSINVKI